MTNRSNHHPNRRRPRQLLPGTADGAHPRHPRRPGRRRPRRLSSDKGSKTDIPKWIEKAGHRLVALETRDGYDEIIVEKVR